MFLVSRIHCTIFVCWLIIICLHKWVKRWAPKNNHVSPLPSHGINYRCSSSEWLFLNMGVKTAALDSKNISFLPLSSYMPPKPLIIGFTSFPLPCAWFCGIPKTIKEFTVYIKRPRCEIFSWYYLICLVSMNLPQKPSRQWVFEATINLCFTYSALKKHLGMILATLETYTLCASIKDVGAEALGAWASLVPRLHRQRTVSSA